jgi:hypothetical protein
MRHQARWLMTLPVVVAFSLCMYAQTSSSSASTSGGSQSGASSNSGMATGTQNSQSNMGTSGAQASDQGTAESGSHKGGKSLKGCVQQSEGAYLLQEDNGKTAMLTGQDMASYVGQEVKVHGSFHKGGSRPATAGAGFGGATGSAGNSSSEGNNSANASAGMSGSGMATRPVAPAGQATSSTATDHPDENFVVNKVDKLSDQCKNLGGKSK